MKASEEVALSRFKDFDLADFVVGPHRGTVEDFR